MDFPSPLRYPGGKARIFPFVANLFYENEILGYSYAEPYAGGAGLALKLLFGEFVDKIYINDYDRAIYSFWMSVIDHTEELCSWIDQVPVDLSSWRHYKSIYVNQENASVLDLGKATFFLNRTNVSGVITGGMIGGVAQTSKYGIDARFYRERNIDRIRRIAKLKHRIRISNLDGISFLDRLDRRKEKIFIYLDPPYFQKADDLYLNSYIAKDHERLSRRVRKLRKKWMVSYDDNSFIFNLYGGYSKVRHSLARGASNTKGNEILIFPDSVFHQASTPWLRAASFV